MLEHTLIKCKSLPLPKLIGYINHKLNLAYKLNPLFKKHRNKHEVIELKCKRVPHNHLFLLSSPMSAVISRIIFLVDERVRLKDTILGTQS